MSSQSLLCHKERRSSQIFQSKITKGLKEGDNNLCSARANLSLLPSPYHVCPPSLPSPRARTTFFPSANKMHAASAAAAIAAAEKDRDGDSAFLLSPQKSGKTFLSSRERPLHWLCVLLCDDYKLTHHPGPELLLHIYHKDTLNPAI